MNMQKVSKCMKTGKSRSQCMKEAYPEKGSGKKGSSKKSGGKKPAY